MHVHHVRAGTGDPLLLVHGIGDSHRTWTRVLEALARAHECFAVDVPGFARSAPLPGAPTVPALAAALAAFMREQGHETFHVAGNSMGGGIALELARTGAARTATALSPVGFVEGWELPYAKASLRLTRALGSLAARPGERLTRSRLMRRLLTVQMVADGARYSPAELAGSLSDLAAAPSYKAAVDPVSEFRIAPATSYAVPVTIAWGSRDRLLLYRRQAPRARERVPAARHVTLRGCGHIPTWEDAGQVTRAILETTAAAVEPAVA